MVVISLSNDEDVQWVLDQGPITWMELKDGEEQDIKSMYSLRAFGFKKGRAANVGLHGTLMANTWGEKEENPDTVICADAPCMVHFKDEGVASVFCLHWRLSDTLLWESGVSCLLLF